MTRTTIPGIGLAAAIGCMFLPSAAFAAEEDTQLWTYFTVDTAVSDNATATLEISPRFREDGEVLQSRVMLDFDIAEGVKLGGGVTHVAVPGANEWRTHQQLQARLGPLSSRTRLEQRFFDGADRTQWRIRQRLNLSQPVTESTDVFGRVEFLYILQDDEFGVDPSVDNWRFAVGAEHMLTEKLEVGASYMLILAPRGAQEDRISHVPMLTLGYSF